MPVPSSGPIELRGDIALEVDGTAAGTNVSLRALSNTAGFSTPDAMSEFYGYSALALGLTPPLIDEDITSSASWQRRSISLTAYAGRQIRLVWHYVSGDSFASDFQLDNIITSPGEAIFCTFENLTHNFQTSRISGSVYTNVTWYSLETGTTAGRFNRDSFNTPSGGTGLDPSSNNLTGGPLSGGGSYHIYAETSGSSGYPQKDFWVRSPPFTLSSSNQTLYFDYAGYGEEIGRFYFHVDVLS